MVTLFFFKQKTAYEIYQCDWSSDVCSSDLFVAWQLAAIMAVIVAVYMASMTWRIRRQLPYNVAVAEAESDQTAALADAITNMATIRAFAGEHYESKRFQKVTDRVHQKFHALTVEVLKTE